MTESWAGEAIGLFCGLCIIAPLVYQINSQVRTPTRSSLAETGECWHLWSVGWLGVGAFFTFVPRSEGKQLMDAPESPRTIGYLAILAGLLCQTVFSLDRISPSESVQQKWKSLGKTNAPWAVGTVVMLVLVRLVHEILIRSRPFYRIFLAVLGLVTIIIHIGGTVLAARDLKGAQLQMSNEIAGLHWMPIAAQMAGLFVGVFTSVLVYTNPEWLGVLLLSLIFVSDGVLIAWGVFVHKRQQHGRYGRLA